MDLGAEMTVEESINLQVLHWAFPCGVVIVIPDEGPLLETSNLFLSPR